MAEKLTRRRVRSWPHRKWHPDDDAVLDRYADAVVTGRYPTAAAAMPDCCRELAAAGRRSGCRTSATCQRLQERVRERGHQRVPLWRSSEERVYQRHVRLLFEGRFKHVRDAADACANVMLRLRSKFRPRPFTAIRSRMKRELRSYDLPRFNGEMIPQELCLFEKYARAVAAGRYASSADATPDCYCELKRMYARVGREHSLHIGRLAGRSRAVVHCRIRAAAFRLGLQFPHRHWLPAEERIFDGWLRWYSKHRHGRRLHPLTRAANGLSDDLAKQGFRRSVCTCKWRLVTTRRRLLLWEEVGGKKSGHLPISCVPGESAVSATGLNGAEGEST